METDLRECRIRFAKDVEEALMCKTDKQKISLVAGWKVKYSPNHVQELLNVVRNKPIARNIAYQWKLIK